MSGAFLECKYCLRKNFRSARGLSQHQDQSKPCKAKKLAEFTKDSGYHTAHEFLLCVPVVRTNGRTEAGFIAQQIQQASAQGSLFCPPASLLAQAKLANCAQKGVIVDKDAQVEDNYLTAAEFWSSEEEDEESDEEDEAAPMDLDSSDDEDANLPHVNDVLALNNGLNYTMRDDFCKYIERFRNITTSYTIKETNCIRLLLVLRHTKASLDTFEEVMKWHLHATGAISSPETSSLAHVDGYITREKLFRNMEKRYRITQHSAQILRQITLPHSKARPQLVCYDARNLLVELLTDPRIRDEDYLFFGNDPLQPPPETLNYVGDLNTGRSYTETYKQLITKPGKQVLLPVIFYIDGANTGQFSDLPITALKFTLGIFNRKARDRDYMWKTLGYVPSVAKFKSKGKRMLIESGHVDSIMAHPDALDGEGENEESTINKAQDLHSMIAVLLESYVKIQETGFVWDLHYRNNVYKDVEFVLFTPFFKVDGDEGDKLCGKYTSRGENVANLCRYCECPTDRSDDPLADYPYKTTAQIQALVAHGDADGLRNISQQNIQNACYKIRFGAHNARGIHGACPAEMLHALLLGMFRYARDCLFEQIGEKGQAAKDFNAMAQELGSIMMRQSDRNLPKTKFANGITKGKLQATEFPGVLLCMAAVLVTTKGSKRLLRRKKRFKNLDMVTDWTLLLETLLQWEVWLKSDQMEVEHVKRAERKHRFIMYLFRKVGNRSSGMGLKLSKFHAIVHMSEDILNFGVPMEFDTGSNESGHKATKKAAKLTQRCEATFDSQTAKRLHEMHLLEMAEQELAGNVAWKYFHNCVYTGGEEPVIEQSFLTGSTLTIYFDAKTQRNVFLNTTRAKDKNHHVVEADFIQFVADLNEKLRIFGRQCAIRTELKRNGVIFRASARFREAVWRDWVMVDWGEEEGHLPCKIWGFVDLTDILPPNSGILHGQTYLEPEVYAIVESSEYIARRRQYRYSELFTPISKIVGGIVNDRVTHLVFLLVTVDAFVKPIAVIPDLGGPPNRYFVIKERTNWAADFALWLEEPHTHDIIDQEDLE